MMKKFENIRTNYNLNQLRKGNLVYSPIKQFEIWFGEVINKVMDSNAMTLSTYDKQKSVQNRVVLLKEIKKDGFVFYTNYNSLKAKQIELNDSVALCFFWPAFQRQVRVNGRAVRLSQKLSNDYFQKRPRKSQISTWASEQSDVVVNRRVLELRFNSLQRRFKNKKIPKPSHWGGYKVIPDSMEFWQGRKNRMHDRFLYKRENGKWILNRLSP